MGGGNPSNEAFHHLLLSGISPVVVHGMVLGLGES